MRSRLESKAIMETSVYIEIFYPIVSMTDELSPNSFEVSSGKSFNEITE